MSNQSNAPSTTSTDWPANALPARWIERLFEEMALTYGRKFRDQWGDADPNALKRHWAVKLAGLSGEEIKRGVVALPGRDWPPTLPEFLKLCRPGIDPVVAWYEAVNGCEARERGEMGEWSHPAIFWAAQAVGPYDIRNKGFSVMRERWTAALAEQLAKSDIRPVPEPAVGLPAPGQTEMTREQARKHLASLSASGVLKRAEDVTIGNRDWARRVLERNDVPAIAKRFAREALGVAE